MSWLSKDKSIALYAALVSFGTYVFIFGFRKSFTVCTFEGLTFGPIAYKTALVITHRIFSLERFDQILVMEDGEIIEAGTHQSLLHLNGKYQEMYTQQQKESAQNA